MLLLAVGYGLTVNLVGFVLFGWDKHCALHGGRRVPERRLLMWAALGGAPAMLFGRSMLRHKTRKQPFRSYLNTIICIQALVAAGLLIMLAGGFSLPPAIVFEGLGL
ncbi:DUF1294 domain-containing protein [uncultured Hoeflea sp.]|uniref:DUF1294 domain-containing protein n=1 Tax=uncultured Hoeflea sp. TaxID=538666 RepID=UPI0030DA65A2|tara:strand:+ start:479 stop:799 length:321 start_codon:yes stop_codon:yes gene_type:complete